MPVLKVEENPLFSVEVPLRNLGEFKDTSQLKYNS